MELTLLELSLDDAEITANAPFSGGRSSGSEEADVSVATADESEGEHDESHTTESQSGPGALVAALLSFVTVVALAVVLKRVLSSEDETADA